MITVIDYEAGNLRSVTNALKMLGYLHQVSQKPADVLGASTVIFPGVGAAGDAMANLRRLGLDSAVKQFASQGRPLLGICLGLQIFLTVSDEGDVPCLSIVPGRVRRLNADLKIPHMGWNQVKQTAVHPAFAGIPDNANFYFVHSYYGVPQNDGAVIGTTDYGVSFCSVMTQGKLLAVQFHPEKSGAWGLRFYDNFLRNAGESPVKN
jgi:glutamine amidotransferase